MFKTLLNFCNKVMRTRAIENYRFFLWITFSMLLSNRWKWKIKRSYTFYVTTYNFWYDVKVAPDPRTRKLEPPSPIGIYLFKVNNRNTRARCIICSKLAIKTPEPRNWRRSGFFIVKFEHISHLVLVFLLLTLRR